VSAVGECFKVAAAAKGLAMVVRVADDVPPTVSCDSLRIQQILNNLLSNATKFTEQGGIGIEVECNGAELLVHVVDSGSGIAAEQHELIFERFRQGNGRVSYQHGGIGQGLALSRALAELMGGQLTLRSSVGEGARFTLALPID
jgi:signal transduction histidine kinase